MRWQPSPKVPAGTERKRIVFAWGPIFVEGYWIWLERHELHEVYVVTESMSFWRATNKCKLYENSDAYVQAGHQ